LQSGADNKDDETMIAVHPGDLAIFYDDRFPPDPSDDPLAPPVNRVAVFVDESGALYLDKRRWKSKVRHISTADATALNNLQLRRFTKIEFASQIAVYFRTHRKNPSYFQAGLNAWINGNMQPFVECRLFPQRPFYIDDDAYNESWTIFAQSLKPGDAIYTVDTESYLSRLIAWATHGTWSHVAWYVGDGMISESTTSGIRTVPIEYYRHRRYWLGAYRHIELMEAAVSSEHCQSLVTSDTRFRRDRYNYPAAMYYGFRSFIGDHSHNLVPNSAMFQGHLIRVAMV
jgi:hypothetical protein